MDHHDVERNSPSQLLPSKMKRATTSNCTLSEELDEGNKSILMSIMSQLRDGTELSKVSLPTFVLEPRSMCERLCDFFNYQEYLYRYHTVLYNEGLDD